MQPDGSPEPLVAHDGSRAPLQTWRLRDLDRGRLNLDHLATALGPEGLRELLVPLGRLLQRNPDPDMALNNLERFLGNPVGAATLPSLLHNRARTLEILLQLLGTSHFF